MAKSKNRKGHKQRVAKRKEQILQEKKKYQKFQYEMIQKMINEEREKGAFENNPQVSPLTQINLPSDPVIQGPQI